MLTESNDTSGSPIKQQQQQQPEQQQHMLSSPSNHSNHSNVHSNHLQVGVSWESMGKTKQEEVI